MCWNTATHQKTTDLQRTLVLFHFPYFLWSKKQYIEQQNQSRTALWTQVIPNLPQNIRISGHPAGLTNPHGPARCWDLSHHFCAPQREGKLQGSGCGPPHARPAFRRANRPPAGSGVQPPGYSTCGRKAARPVPRSHPCRPAHARRPSPAQARRWRRRGGRKGRGERAAGLRPGRRCAARGSVRWGRGGTVGAGLKRGEAADSPGVGSERSSARVAGSPGPAAGGSRSWGPGCSVGPRRWGEGWRRGTRKPGPAVPRLPWSRTGWAVRAGGLPPLGLCGSRFQKDRCRGASIALRWLMEPRGIHIQSLNCLFPFLFKQTVAQAGWVLKQKEPVLQWWTLTWTVQVLNVLVLHCYFFYLV